MSASDGLQAQLDDIIKAMGGPGEGEGLSSHLGGSNDTPSSWVNNMDKESKENLQDGDKSPLLKDPCPPARVGAEWAPRSATAGLSLSSLRSEQGDQRSIPKSMEFPSYQGGSPSPASELENLPLLDLPIMRKKFLSRSEGQLGLTERQAEPDPGLRMSKLSNHRLSRMSFKSSVLADFDFDNQDTDASEEEKTADRIMFADVTQQNKEEQEQQEETGGVSCLYSVLIVLVNVAYLLVGAIIFMKYENEGRAKEMEHDYETKLHLMSYLKSHQDGDSFMNRLLLLQQSMCTKGNDKERGDWNYIGAFTFASTIISSIGYGLVSPGVALSKYVTMGYALLGLPLFLLYLSYFDDFLNQFFNHLFDMMKSVYSLRMTRVRKNIVKAVLLVVILVVMIMTNTVCVFRTTPLYNDGNNNDFTTFDAVYWQVIRLTTIGFGDIVRYVESPLATVIITMFLLPVGMCVMSAYIQILRSLCGKRKIRVCCKNTKQDACQPDVRVPDT